jgi:hypothetical protein
VTRLVQALPEGPLDIVGDIHGELEALLKLLHRLGCDPDALRSRRPVVFVGDLVDRGPDSPGVVAVVRRLVEAGLAHCVAGNHELNLLLDLDKEGNGWARGDATDHYQVLDDSGVHDVPFGSRVASRAEAASALAFFETLPLALEREDLRVVHACWHPPGVAALPPAARTNELAQAWSRRIAAELESDALLSKERAELGAFADLKRLDVRPDRPLPAHTAAASRRQSDHPVKVLTSGLEVPVPFADIFFVGGKWRFVRRDAWWKRYDAAPAVVVGHYWRRRGGARVPGKPDAWETPRWTDWTGPRGNVFCVDYSVGRRFVERGEGRQDAFAGGLGALRWPERTLVFDDRDAPIPTTAWGG